MRQRVAVAHAAPAPRHHQVHAVPVARLLPSCGPVPPQLLLGVCQLRRRAVLLPQLVVVLPQLVVVLPQLVVVVVAEARAAVAHTQALGHSSSLGRVGPVHAAWPADGLSVDTNQFKVSVSTFVLLLEGAGLVVVGTLGAADAGHDGGQQQEGDQRHPRPHRPRHASADIDTYMI